MAPSQKEILRRTIDALEASLSRFPDNEKIMHQLALALAQTGRFDGHALKIFERVSRSFPTDMKIQQATSIGYLINQSGDIVRDIQNLSQIDQGSLSRNIDRLLRLTTEYPDSPHIHRALGDLQLLRGEERDAIHHYRCAMALGITELDGLCAHFQNVRRLRELSGYAAVFFAEIYQRLGSHAKANQIFLDYMAAKNPEKIVLEKYSEFLERRIEDTQDRSDENYLKCIRQLAQIALLKGNMSEALTWARQLTPDQVAKSPRLAKDLARRLMAMEDFRLAFDYLSRVPLDEESKAVLNEMTVHLEKRGELDTAVYVLQYINANDELARESRQAAARGPENNNDLMIEIETDLQMAELHWKNRRWDQAFERYMRVLELGYEEYRGLLEPLDLLIPRLKEVTPRQLSFLANFFGERREWRRTITYAQMALRQDPDTPTMSQRLLQACERILLEFPNDYDVCLINGDEQLRLGNIERAMQDFRRCAEAPEYKMKASRRLALAMFKAGDLLGALERFRDLPVLETEDLEKMYDLMVAFANSGQHRQAFETAKLIVEYDANFRDVAAKAAQYEEKMNQNNAGFVIDPKMRELIGDHSIGRYKYMCKIGSGGMGVVHKVVDLKTNTIVAMKILREGLSSSGKAIDRFFREARIAATLRHKNIVNILDYNISNNYGQSYIAMEFVDGPSLRDVIERKFAETVDIANDDVLQTLQWVSQLCDALDATHKKGIIHRDIKPDNVLVGPGDIIKITDFGIVHIEEATFTPTGALIGTPRYMSPEQVHGGRIDQRSDIYAVGIIIYELLIGSPPFISGDISYQQVNVLPTPPREICPAVPPAVNRIIMKCLEKAPGDRYASSLDCKRDVDEAYIRLGGDPLKLRPDAHTTSPAPQAPSAMPDTPKTAPKLPRDAKPVTVEVPAGEGSATDFGIAADETPVSMFDDIGLPTRRPAANETRDETSEDIAGRQRGLDSDLDLS